MVLFVLYYFKKEGYIVSEKIIESLSGFVEEVGKLTANAELYFRGENRHFDLRIPSIYRVSPGTIAQRSKEYYARLFSESEEIKFDGLSPFKRLSELQHFGGLTRFLDITQNSLVALYFAVEKTDEDGFVFVYRNSELKTDEGDTAYLKAAIHFIETKIVSDFIRSGDSISDDVSDQNTIFIEKLMTVDSQNGKVFNKLNKIRDDLMSAQIIVASKSNSRIAHQQGAFIAPAFEYDEEYSDQLKRITESINKLSFKDDVTKDPIIFRITQKSKNSILKGLAKLGINAGTVYPDIQHQSDNLIKVLTNYKIDSSQVDKLEPNIEDKINKAITDKGLLVSNISFLGEESIDSETLKIRKFISVFHTKQVYMIEQKDEYFAGIRADHFVVEVGFSENSIEDSDNTGDINDEKKYALITANHKGERRISIVDLYPKVSNSKQDMLITSLSESGNFSTTHSIIGQLSKFNQFTNEQVEILANILKENSQVNLVVGDRDVKVFYKKIFEDNTEHDYMPILNELI